MFLKFLFLRREGKTYLAAQVPQRTLLFDWAVALIFLFSLSHLFRRESGAKVRCFFQTTKFFENFFQKNFQNLCFWLSLFYEREIRCKDKASFLNFQIFRNLFSKIFKEPFCSASQPFRRETGCKVTAKNWNFQIFWQLFCTFSAPIPLCL